MLVWLRRIMWIGLLGGAGIAGYTVWQRRSDESRHTPEWPPLAPAGDAGAPPVAPGPATTPVESVEEPVDAPGRPGATSSAPDSATLSTGTSTSAPDSTPTGGDGTADENVVRPLADAPDADEPVDEPSAPPPTWVPPIGGECPDGYPVKANESSGIYHVPGGRFYARTNPERCYASTDAAEADGYRAAKS